MKHAHTHKLTNTLAVYIHERRLSSRQAREKGERTSKKTHILRRRHTPELAMCIHVRNLVLSNQEKGESKHVSDMQVPQAT